MMKLCAMYFRLDRLCGVFLCGCVALTAVAEARSGEFHRKQSIADDGADIDHGELLFHGNYCGPGSRPGARPVDALDAACMRHDTCSKKGVPSCACNARFQYEAAAVANNPAQPPDIQFLASITAAGAALLICQPPLQVSRDPTSRSAWQPTNNGFPAIDSYRPNRSQYHRPRRPDRS
jgi:hypothetical protein